MEQFTHQKWYCANNTLQHNSSQRGIFTALLLKLGFKHKFISLSQVLLKLILKASKLQELILSSTF